MFYRRKNDAGNNCNYFLGNLPDELQKSNKRWSFCHANNIDNIFLVFALFVKNK